MNRTLVYHGASPYVDHQVVGQQGMDAIYYWDDCPSYEGDSVGVSSPSSGIVHSVGR